MANRAFPFLLAMVCGLSLPHQYAHGQWSEDFLDDFESDYRRLRKMSEDMLNQGIKMDELSERNYREQMPILEKKIASFRAAGNETEARGWEGVKAILEKTHEDVLERRRAGYKNQNPDSFDVLIFIDELKIVEGVLTGRSTEDAINDLHFLVMMKTRIRSKDAYLSLQSVSKSFPRRLFKH